jgi:hypothetical protein
MKALLPDFGLRLRQTPQGWQVLAVTPGSPGAEAGPESGDLILRAWGRPTASPLGPTMMEHVSGYCWLHVQDHQTGTIQTVLLAV